MKRTYIHPQMIAVKLQSQSYLMEGSTYSSADTNLDGGESIGYYKGGITGDARVKGTNIWDDEW